MNNSIGERMKNNYEFPSRYYLTRRTPVIIRVDGRAFHSFTRKMNKPFSRDMISFMDHATIKVSNEIQGFKLAYVQSDEVSFLLTDYDTLQTDAWFGYNKSKIETITSSLMSAYFNRVSGACEVFDARAFNIPVDEVSNYFLWRALDWQRNSLTMYASSFFSHKELMNKNANDKHEMLNSIGKNWAVDCYDREKNGAWITKEEMRYDIQADYKQIDQIVSPLID